MYLSSLLQGVGSAGQFSSRIFLPALITALLLRFGPSIPIIDHMGLLALARQGQPTWFTSDLSLIVLTVLSVLEIFAQKNPEAREVLREMDIYIKPLMAALTCFGYIRSTDAAFVNSTMRAGFGGDIAPLLSGFLTYRLAVMRKHFTQVVFDHLEGTQFDHLLSWLEDAWSLFGTLLLIVLPLLMVLSVAAIWTFLFLFRCHLKSREELSKIACPGCGHLMYPCATACPACRFPNALPCEIGFLGQSKPFPARDPLHHIYRLVEKRRCPLCAAHRAARRALAACPECGSNESTESAFTDGYLAYISQRVPTVLGVCFLMSLVPILGLISSTVYSRMQLVLPFSQYLPLGKNFVLRWSIRILFLMLVFLQLIPLLGGLVGPLMAYISYVVYRRSYVGLVKGDAEARLLREAHSMSP